MKNIKSYLPPFDERWFRLPEYIKDLSNYVTFSDLVQGDRIISGGVAWKETGLEFESTEINYIINNVRYTAPPRDPITLDTTEPGLDRIDVFAVNTSGELVVIKGTESSDPIKPDVIEGEQLEVTFTIIRDGQVVPDGVTITTIYNENLQVIGGEWNTAKNSNSIDLASTEDSQLGDVSIRFRHIRNGNQVIFTNDSPIDGSNVTSVIFRVKLLEGTPNTNNRLFLRAYESSNPLASSVTINDGNFGFQSDLLNAWQTIIVPASALGISNTSFDELRITGGRVFMNFFLDNVVLQSGLGTNTVIPEYTLGLDTTDLNLLKDGGVVSTVDLSGLGGGTAPTGLEAIDEGNGIGWRLIGRNPANFGNIGLNAIDFSTSTGASTTRGALGQSSAVFGQNNQIAGTYNLIQGQNNVVSSGATTNIIVGDSNNITNGLFTYYNAIFGDTNNVRDYANLVVGYNHDVRNSAIGSSGQIVAGIRNVTDAYYGGAIGGGLQGTGSYGLILGVANVPFVENNSGSTAVQRSLLTIGNGTVNGVGVPQTTKDAFKVYWQGQVIAPSLTTTLIDGEATGKILITREWVNAQGFGIGTPALQAVTDVGNITTNFLKVDNGANKTGAGVEFYNTDGASVSLGMTTDTFDSAGALNMVNNSGGIRLLSMSLTNADTNTWLYPNRTHGSSTFLVASVSDGGSPIVADATGNINIASLLSGTTPTLQAVTTAGNTTDTNIEIANNAQRWFQVSNVGFTTGSYIDNTGYVNLINGDTLIDIDASARSIYFGEGFFTTQLFATEPTSNNVVTIQNGSGTLAFLGDVPSNLDEVLTGGNTSSQSIELDNGGTTTLSLDATNGVVYDSGSLYSSTWLPSQFFIKQDGVGQGSLGDSFLRFEYLPSFRTINLQRPVTEPASNVTVTLPSQTGTMLVNSSVSASVATSRNFTLSDANNIVTLNNASPVTATIPANASVAFPVGTKISVINLGAGTVTVGITSDTLNQNVGGLTLAQYDKRTLTKVATTTWVLGF